MRVLLLDVLQGKPSHLPSLPVLLLCFVSTVGFSGSFGNFSVLLMLHVQDTCTSVFPE